MKFIKKIRKKRVYNNSKDFAIKIREKKLNYILKENEAGLIRTYYK